MSLAKNEAGVAVKPARRARQFNTKVFAIVVAVLIHATVLLLLYRAHSDFALTSRAKPGGMLRVTLVAPARKPVVQPPAPQPQVPRPIPHQKVLATHHASPRQVVAPDPKPEAHDEPVVMPPVPPAPSKPAQPASPAEPASILLPTPGQPGKNVHLTCHIPAPPYPPKARRLGHEGTVELMVTIDTTGRVSAAVVQKSSGYEELDEAAQQAMFSGRCDPLLQAGQPISATAVQPLSFHLDN